MKFLKIIDYVFEIHWEKNTAQENNLVDLSFDFFFFFVFFVWFVWLGLLFGLLLFGGLWGFLFSFFFP